MTTFDNIAESYYNHTPALPQQYIHLLKELFQLKPTDFVMDVGCGSGDLALEFAQESNFVEGLDASGVMIDMAERKDQQKQVKWIHIPVEEFHFDEEKYKLLMLFESYHLFHEQKTLIQRFARALKPGGFLAAGWAVYEWDIPLKEAIQEIFASYNIFLDDWGDWTCPTFDSDIQEAGVNLTAPEQKEIHILAKTPIERVIQYLFSVSKTSTLPKEAKETLVTKLYNRFLEIYPSGITSGHSTYVLRYSKKLP